MLYVICHTNDFLKLCIKQSREDYMSNEAGHYASSSVATEGSPNPERTQQRRQTRSVPKQRVRGDLYVFANLPRAANAKIKTWNFRFGVRYEADSPILEKMMREAKAKLKGQEC
jgi:hypothetical protein